MKYSISEDRLKKIVYKYLDELWDKSSVDLSYPYMLTVFSGDLNDNFTVLFNYDKKSKVLVYNNTPLDFFGLDEDHLTKIVTNWFENKFKVDISFARPFFK